MNNNNDHDTYIIPPNFVDTGTFFGGMFKARNVIEAGVLASVVGIPVFVCLPFGLTTRIIVLCLTAMPLGLVALIGISGESLSSFLFIFLKYLKNRRVVGIEEQSSSPGTSNDKPAPAKKRQKKRSDKQKEHSGRHKESRKQKLRSGQEDFPAEFDEVKAYEIKQKLRPAKRKSVKGNRAKEPSKAKKLKKERVPRQNAPRKNKQEQKPACLNPVADYLPIEKIDNGIIYTKDHRFVKVVEIIPINFLLRSAREQRSIIYSFISYLKISPVKLQFKVLTRRADIGRHLDTVRQEMTQETNEQCRLMQEDYLQFVQQISSREAVTRRFFLIFEYEPWSNSRNNEESLLIKSQALFENFCEVILWHNSKTASSAGQKESRNRRNDYSFCSRLRRCAFTLP